MANSIYILTKQLADKNEIIKKMEAYAYRNNIKVNYYEDLNLSLYSAATSSGLDIYFSDQEEFDRLMEDDYWGTDYSVFFYITAYPGDYNKGDEMAVPLLKALLKDYPDWLILNEENPEIKPYIYTKAHLDAYTGKYFDDIFLKPPRI